MNGEAVQISEYTAQIVFDSFFTVTGNIPDSTMQMKQRPYKLPSYLDVPTIRRLRTSSVHASRETIEVLLSVEIRSCKFVFAGT